ncbi:multidrug resistance efflux pump [Lederbergia galactosidilyticus]|nr:multidrug resistance efflux pump [Lederbergia galactosidilytica]
MRKKNITLFILILIMAIVWGILYWVFIAPNVRMTK